MQQHLKDGNDLLYSFFKEWIESDPEAAQSFVKKAIDGLGIWMHPQYYHELPIFVPYAVRDSTCRHSGPDHSDEWGAPDAYGYFRDDNSLIKGIVSSMPVMSRTIWLMGKKKGSGFTASHVWRRPTNYAERRILASRMPNLNSFVPNLVWLPEQIAKLTDREGSFAQRYLQKLSRHIYGDVKVKAHARQLTDEVWALLPEPDGLDEVEMPSIGDIAFFAYKDNIVTRRKKTISGVCNACQAILVGGPLPAGKLISARYTEGLPRVSRESLIELKTWLGSYLDALGQTNAEWGNN